MKRSGEAFEIAELAWPREGPGAKTDRVGRLRPDFETGHFFLSHLAYSDGGKILFLKIVDGELRTVEAKTETKLMARTTAADGKHRLMRPIKQKDE